ncbi:hypothetical protein PY365_14765 [Roseiarcaceae bacterium H3SJ34-1]|uniref:hypothetical protein n=1 Tax=Terripilifer ovatus TaxID=3032367 RepID=UPI003AB960C8|nr:hypothetical protein [Roseiarcaceae bacterium H3SJ34-1]
MFSVLDDKVPLKVLQQDDAPLALARHFGLRPRWWAEAGYRLEPRTGLDRIGGLLAERLAHRKDLHFIKLNAIWSSDESVERVAAFRERTGLDAATILRRPVVSHGAQPNDWAALFTFVLNFGWDAAVVSREARALVWFSHDEFLKSTPSSLIRGM